MVRSFSARVGIDGSIKAAARCAGTARITSSTSSDPAPTPCRVSDHPPDTGLIAATEVPVSTRQEIRSRNTSINCSMPPLSELNIAWPADGGPVRLGGFFFIARAARMRLPYFFSISRNDGNVPRMLSLSGSLTKMPAINGPANLSTASRPRRRPMNEPSDSSPGAGRGGRK